MVHRLFAPIVMAGIALGSCQRERRNTAPATMLIPHKPDAARLADASVANDSSADTVIDEDAQPVQAQPRPHRKSPGSKAAARNQAKPIPRDFLMIL